MIELFVFFLFIGAVKLAFLLVSLGVTLLWLWMLARVARRAGFSGWWCLVGLSTTAFAIAIWVAAFVEWPGRPRTEVLPPFHPRNS